MTRDVLGPQANKGSQLDETKRNIAELEAQLAKMEAGEDMDAEWAEHLDKLDQFNEPMGDDADDSDQITISNAGFPDANWAFRIGYMAMNLVMLTLVVETPHTLLRDRRSDQLDGAHVSGMYLHMGLSWVFYFILQGSNPGYVDPKDPSFVDSSTARARGSLGPVPRAGGGGGGREIELVQRSPRHAGSSPRGSLEGIVLDDPQVMERGGGNVDSKPEDEDEGDGMIGGDQWPPMRAKYCRAVKKWVATYDHYCPFLNTPIGERNRCRFWWFLFFQTQAVTWAIGVVHSGFHQVWGEGSSWFMSNAHALVVAIILYIMLLIVAPLWLFHSFLAASNMTTNEFMRSDEVKYLQGTEDFDLPFSDGLCGNLKLYFMQDEVVDAMRVMIFRRPERTWHAKRWARPKKIVRDSEDWRNNLWQNKYWSCC